MSRRVVVTGIGLVSPLGIGTEQTWQGLVDGRSGAGPITRFDTAEFSVKIACEVKGFDPASWFEAALAARERLVPTAVPEGVAFLHARRRAADKFPTQFVAMARSKAGVAFGSPDMGPTHIFFLLALRNDALHLRWLSRLAWIVRSPGRLSRMIDAGSAEEIHAILLEAAAALPASLRPHG